MKKKDKLFEIIKKDETIPLMEYLSNQDLLQFSLMNKKYYMLLMPFLKVRQLDQQKLESNNNKQSNNQINKKKPKNKNKKKNSPSNSDQQTLMEIQVQVDKVPMNKWAKKFNINEWQKIDTLPFFNSYLNKKLQIRSSIFYQNKETKEIIFLNRSFVDPNLDFQKGSFNDQLDTDIYEHMYEEAEQIDLDFSSRQTLLKRQKQMLERINKKKAVNEENQIISYEKELQKAVNMKRFAIILCFGGSFSLGVYQGSKCILHKSDKKYVCRKKAGQRQLNKDKQSGTSIKSMGSQIRRDQEKKHVINVNEILNQNKDSLFQCEIIFLQAPGMNRLYIINTNETMAQLQSKLRSVCLTAKKANYTEVQAIFDNISKVNVVKLKE